MRSVVLIDGSVAQSDSAHFKHECLARFVLDLPTLAERRAFLADFEKRHGAEETERLKYQMLQQKESARGAKA